MGVPETPPPSALPTVEFTDDDIVIKFIVEFIITLVMLFLDVTNVGISVIDTTIVVELVVKLVGVVDIEMFMVGSILLVALIVAFGKGVGPGVETIITLLKLNINVVLVTLALLGVEEGLGEGVANL